MNRIDTSALPEDIREWIRVKTASGLYDTPESVLQCAMEALEIQELNQKLDMARKQIGRGEGSSYDSAGLDELRKRIREKGMSRLSRQREPA